MRPIQPYIDDDIDSTPWTPNIHRHPDHSRNSYQVFSGDGDIICTIHFHNHQHRDDMNAMVSLMCAAPDFLHHLKMADSAIDSLYDALGISMSDRIKDNSVLYSIKKLVQDFTKR